MTYKTLKTLSCSLLFSRINYCNAAAARPVIPSVNSRPSIVSGRSLNVLEHCQMTFSLHHQFLPFVDF